MRKRRNNAFEGDGPRKRLRVIHEAPTFEEISSPRQLMQLLAFDQDQQKARHGLQSFKVLLDRLNSTPTADDIAILYGYLDSARAKREESRGDGYGEGEGEGEGEHDSEAVYLPDIMDTWALAAKTNNDNLLSAVPVVLALLLRYLSGQVERVAFALGLGRSLLRRRQLELVARNLTAEKTKEFVISPTLRLLREVVCLDGGALARAVFRARNTTFRALARNMGLRFLGEGVEDTRQRTSARTNAVRFLLAALHLLPLEAKAELLTQQRDVLAALTRSIRDDPPCLVREILDGLLSDVVHDKKLPRLAKLKLLNTATLIRLGGLYSYAHDGAAGKPDGEGEPPAPISDVVHAFFMHVCTSPSAGLLREQYGCYPKGVEWAGGSGDGKGKDGSKDDNGDGKDDSKDDNGDGKDDNDNDNDDADYAPLDRIVWMDRFADDVPVHNSTLAEFMATLRPWSSTRQLELVAAIFAQAPELISWYYLNKRAFTFEPKLSATWVGYAALLFRTIQVPLPAYFRGGDGGIERRQYARDPPPTSVVIDHILPLPLTQKVLARCLAHRSKLVPFLAVRLLALAMDKLRRALQMHHEAARRHPLEAAWPEAARRLVGEFCRRCPPMQDLINTYRATPSTDLLCREAASRALRLYYQVVPQVALLAKFDVSALLIGVLRLVGGRPSESQDQEAGPAEANDQVLRILELENLLAMAGSSPGMRWFFQADGLRLSPYVALLKLYTGAPAGLALDTVRSVLDFVGSEQQLVLPAQSRTTTPARSLAALFSAMHAASKTPGTLFSDAVWAFVDNGAIRCAAAPIKYIDMVCGLPTPSVDPFTLALVEQLPFATAKADAATLDDLARFMLQYLACCGGDRAALTAVCQRAAAAFSNATGSRAAAKLAKGLPKRAGTASSAAAAAAADAVAPLERASPASSDTMMADAAAVAAPSAEDLLGMAPVRELDNAALTRWTTKAADELVEDGHAAALIMLLASEHTSIRREALVNLAKMAAKMRESSYDEKDQVWLLLSELVETARGCLAADAAVPVPTHLLAFACHALDVVRNPLHGLYATVNQFLTAGPVWKPSAVPLVHEILQRAPAQDDAYYTAVHWLWAYLLDCLRTPADVDRFRSRRLFEAVLSAAANPYMRAPLRRQALRILCRAAGIDGGSTTLLTRSGVASWLAVQAACAGSTETDASGPSSSESARGRDKDKKDAWKEGEETAVLRALLQRLWDSCDQPRVDSWSLHGIPETFKLQAAGGTA